MKLFVAAVAVVYSVAASTSLWLSGQDIGDDRWLFFFLTSAWLAPILTAWAAAEALHMARPRRLFTQGLSDPLASVVAGFSSATGGVCLGAVGVVFCGELVPDVLVMGASMGAGTLIVLALCRAVRTGTCARCAYKLEGITPACHGCCPECGFSLHLQPAHGPSPSRAAESPAATAQAV